MSLDCDWRRKKVISGEVVKVGVNGSATEKGTSGGEKGVNKKLFPPTNENKLESYLRKIL